MVRKRGCRLKMSDHAGHDSEEEAKLPSHPTPHQMASEIALSLLRAEVGDSPPEGSVGAFLKDDDGPSAPNLLPTVGLSVAAVSVTAAFEDSPARFGRQIR